LHNKRVEIRKAVLSARMRLSPEFVYEKSRTIIDKIITSNAYKMAKSLMVYVDFNNEVQTGKLITYALADNKKVSVPVTSIKEKKLTSSMLLAYPEDLAPGAWGILEPKPDLIRPVDPGDIDLVVVPGVSFDPKGNRLGYGAGFYDRFLPRTKTGAIFIAPCFEMQVVKDVFPDVHDVPVHLIFTEERILYSGRAGILQSPLF
jgi:5-formyltetrahydrofolate cyclo-ligase